MLQNVSKSGMSCIKVYAYHSRFKTSIYSIKCHPESLFDFFFDIHLNDKYKQNSYLRRHVVLALIMNYYLVSGLSLHKHVVLKGDPSRSLNKTQNLVRTVSRLIVDMDHLYNTCICIKRFFFLQASLICTSHQRSTGITGAGDVSSSDSFSTFYQDFDHV